MSGKERELSILFADVSGSARLYEKLGDAEAVRAVERCVKRMERAVETFQGKVAKVVGDEMMAVFESAEDAFNAASEMQQRVTDLPPISGVKLKIRLGFASGDVSEADGEFSGEVVASAARLAGLAKAGQVLTNEETVARFPESLQLFVRDRGRTTAKGRAGELHLFEVIWQENDALATGSASAGEATQPGSRLCVRYAGEVMVLDDKRQVLSMGRDAACDLIIRDRRASRKHGQIERRGDKYVLSDVSTNGTYVQLKGEAEFFLRRGELVLQGSGRICFAAPGGSEGADIAEFEPL